MFNLEISTEQFSSTDFFFSTFASLFTDGHSCREIIREEVLSCKVTCNNIYNKAISVYTNLMPVLVRIP